MFIEAVLYQARTGTPWRDLPDEFGDWDAGMDTKAGTRKCAMVGRGRERIQRVRRTPRCE